LAIEDKFRVAETLARALTELVVPPGWSGGEESLTALVVQPAVMSAIGEIGIDGLIVAGDGRERAAPTVSWSGWQFRPDVAVLFRNQRLLAVEVKLLRGRGSGDAGAKGLGQATIYRKEYEYTCVALYATECSQYQLDTSAEPWAVLPCR
jgi:hypothetical protein